MAQTETKVAQVTLKDSSERNVTINIDNPKDNLSLNQIKAAFAPAISGGWLLANNGSQITEVVEAKYSQVIKTQINGLPVTVSPASLDITISTDTAIGSSVTQSVNVSNGVPIVARCDAGNSKAINTTKIMGSRVDLLMYRLSNESSSLSGTLTIYFEGDAKVQVPVTVTQQAIS